MGWSGVWLAAVLALPTYTKADIIGVSWGVDSVVRINESTGVGAAIGHSGFSSLNSLAVNGSGTIYSADSRLVTIDPSTGAGTAGATLNFGGVNVDVRGLAFSAGNVLFAINSRLDTSSPDYLYTINTATGVGTLIGSTGLSAIQGLDFSPNGILYAWDVIVGLTTINPATGVATDVGPAGGLVGQIQSIAFAPDGTLYGARDALFTINVATGDATLVGSGGYSDVRGIVYIPEPTIAGLLASGIALLAWQRKRSHRPACLSGIASQE